MKLQIVGGGKMGEALLGGMLSSGWASASEIAVVELSEERRNELETAHSGLVVGDAVHKGVDALVAVKPQYVEGVVKSLGEANSPRLLSVAAGVTTEKMEAAAPDCRVVRCMPNTPALVGQGASAIAAGSKASDADLDWAESILSEVGMVVRVDETDLDAVTGVSGSGPAYIFHMAEAMTAAGINAGLAPEVADALTRQTLLGAATLLSESGEDPAVLRQNVTSPGGTTAAGLQVLSNADFMALVDDVVRAAVARSIELGQ